MRIAQKGDKKLVCEILISAFEPLKEDNSINLIVGFKDNRVTKMRLLMSYLFDKAIKQGEIYISKNEKACLFLQFSNKDRFSLKQLWSDVKLGINCIGITRVPKILRRQKIISRNYPKIDHIRPMIAGVVHEHKKDGTAARLMLQVMKKFRENTKPVLVDAAAEETVNLYKRLGFKVINVEQDLGFPLYILRMN